MGGFYSTMLNKYEVTEKIEKLERDVTQLRRDLIRMGDDFMKHDTRRNHDPKWLCDHYGRKAPDLETIRHLALEVCRLLSNKGISIPSIAALAVIRLQNALL